jgi:hypothetical protein
VTFVLLTLADTAARQLWGVVQQISPSTSVEIVRFGSGSLEAQSISRTLDAGIGYGEDLRDDERHVGWRPQCEQLQFAPVSACRC